MILLTSWLMTCYADGCSIQTDLYCLQAADKSHAPRCFYYTDEFIPNPIQEYHNLGLSLLFNLRT